MSAIAIYDMDKTITRRPTWTRFLVDYARHEAPWRLALLPVLAVLALGYPLRLVSRARLKEHGQRLLIGPRTAPERMTRAARRFAARERQHGMFADATARIASDRTAGFRIVIATASHSYYAQAIADTLGVDALIATEAMRDSSGTIRARLSGANCYGEAKRERIVAWLAAQGIDRASTRMRCYSDHISDAPMLDWADEAFVINPGAALAKLAHTRGWTRCDWR